MGIVGPELSKKFSGLASGEPALLFQGGNAAIGNVDDYASAVGFVGFTGYPAFRLEAPQDIRNARSGDPGTVGNLGRAELSARA